LSPASLLVLGFDGPELPSDVARLLSQGLAGVCLFADNIVGAEQVRSLCAEIRTAAAPLPPPLIAVDQEGGKVQRLRKLGSNYPPAREVGARGPLAAREIGLAIGKELASLGFNLDFAPVLDVDSNPANPIIADRAFGSDPDTVTACGLAFAEGLAEAGILPCGKHFPGHGDASLDSHKALPVIEADRETLWRRELLPFQAAVSAGVPMLMSAHCVYPALDPYLPATLSRAVLTSLLRQDLGFQGIVVSDELHMQAIRDRFSPGETLLLGVEAGLDLFLYCGDVEDNLAFCETFERLVRDRQVPLDAVEQSAARVMGLRRKLQEGPQGAKGLAPV